MRPNSSGVMEDKSHYQIFHNCESVVSEKKRIREQDQELERQRREARSWQQEATEETASRSCRNHRTEWGEDLIELGGIYDLHFVDYDVSNDISRGISFVITA